MHNKQDRLNAIIRILEENNISKQEELLLKINTLGFDVTQATLSRDLKLLNAGTTYDATKGHIYTLPQTKIKQTPSFSNKLLDAIISIECTNTMVVIKTQSGFANSVAAQIDASDIPSAAGSIAGNDTIFIAVKRDSTPQSIIEDLNKNFNSIAYVLKP
ncbi:MAG: hypothetical protein JXR60_04790 [Bacteroidales bacterium]|nr:hypothetical protein [Bacteroidales bacterium]